MLSVLPQAVPDFNRAYEQTYLMPESIESPFLALPPEIRVNVYSILLNPDANKFEQDDGEFTYNFKPSIVIFKLNKQIHNEAKKVFHDLNTFVRIETPWPEAERHAQDIGHVPVIATGEIATSFAPWTMNVRIDASRHSFFETQPQWFIVLVDDLHLFTRMWYHFNLSYPRLNAHLGLDLHLRDPLTPSYETPHIPKSLQRKLLLPFSTIHELNHTTITGTVKPYATLETELRKLQATPHPPPEHHLREATRLKTLGNTYLTASNYRLALETYTQAWAAIHIDVRGRQRHVHADAFYQRQCREEPYVGRNAHAERTLLRVQLVANTCLVYLKQENWEECAFWGMRSIEMIRENMREARGGGREGLEAREEAIQGFVGADSMGRIYYRTGVAMRELGDEGEARRLLRVAEVYLPQDKSVKEALASVALRLG